MKTRELTCIVCPRGCQLTVTLDDKGGVQEVTGFVCPRGKQYAIDECTHPMRTLTTTAPTVDGGVIPVKTAAPIPRELLPAAMGEINRLAVALPAHIGDVLISNLLGTGVSVVVTANKE